jgi:hypothetical protein
MFVVRIVKRRGAIKTCSAQIQKLYDNLVDIAPYLTADCRNRQGRVCCVLVLIIGVSCRSFIVNHRTEET